MRARGEQEAWPAPPLYSLGPPLRSTASVKVLAKERNRGTTPRDRDMQCDICGVERIMWRGKDVLTDLLLYVGERCFYYVKEGQPTLIDKKG